MEQNTGKGVTQWLQSNSDEFRTAEKRGYLVVKGNGIIQESRFKPGRNMGGSLTMQEQKVLLYVISKIKPEDTELGEQVFDIQEFCEVCGLRGRGEIYRELRRTVQRLRDRSMWVTLEDGTEALVSWISKAKMSSKSGKIIIQIDQDMKPYLLQLKTNFTAYQLRNVVRMKSKYGIMLYELLKSYEYMGHSVQMGLYYLKELLDCTSYESFTNFKTRVIKPALDDINNYSELAVHAEYIKTGRQYTDIVFHCVNLEYSTKKEDKEELEKRFRRVESELYAPPPGKGKRG